MSNKKELYDILVAQVEGFTDGIPHFISNLSNISAIINMSLPDLNWVGFYLIPGRLPEYFDLSKIPGKEELLIVGPFQGKPACIEIKPGHGVCGTAVSENSVQLVANVHEFPGHIACDCASNSEIVLPIHNKQGEVVGVLDIDSPTLGRFTEEDRDGLLLVVEKIEDMLA